MNADIENHTKIVHDIPGIPFEVIGVDIFTFSNNTYLCIVDYFSKFQVVKKAEDMSADSLILTCKDIFSEFGLLKKMSDMGGNFISDKFKQFCKNMSIEKATSSSYHHQSNRQVEACIKFIKHTMKTCIKTNEDIHVALLHIRSTPLEPGLPAQLHCYSTIQYEALCQ